MRREMNFSSTIVPRILVGFLAALWLLAFASPATADFTHKYIGQITLASGTSPQPSGVEPDGTLIVFLEGESVIAKYDIDGNPVDFSALGTNIIDGQGGLNCPAVPADCDRVPAGQFGPFIATNNIAVVDQSGGPADGYIYVRNHDANRGTGEIAVFAPSGKFLGTVDETQAVPASEPAIPVASLSIAPNGTIYVSRGFEEGIFTSYSPIASADGGHVDAFAPIDGNPAHDQFVGQLRFGRDFPPEYAIGAGSDGAFVRNGSGWRWYSLAEMQKPGIGRALAKDYLPFPSDNNSLGYDYGAVNPTNGNIHRFTEAGMSIWDETAHRKVGPTIPGGGHIGDGARSIAFDNNGGPEDGRFYMRGGTNTISVFSAPVIVPDINVEDPDQGHTSATVNVEIDTAGGPEVTACELSYGLTGNYGTTKPCVPPPPYTEDAQVSIDLSGLFTEADYHYRLIATNENGTNSTVDNVLHTAAVLGVKTEAVTNLHSTAATLNGSLDPDGMATTYRFQYGLDTKYDLETPWESTGLGSGEIALDPTDVAELQPGRTYHYRLVAKNGLGTSFGPDRTFTAPARPQISGLYSSKVTATSASLHAQVNNFDLASEYHFEYGPNVTYGQSTPVLPLGPDASPQEVGAQISGLQAGITYNFRLVATNQYGTSHSADGSFDFSPPSCPNSHVRQQTGSNYLPDCRAYELVSPPRAGSIQLFPGDFVKRLEQFNYPEIAPRYTNNGYASNPARFGFYGGLGGLAGTESPNLIYDHFMATRGDRGWESFYVGLPGHVSSESWRGECSLSMDKCIDFRIRLTPEGQLGASPFPYVWDSTGKSLGRWPTNLQVVPAADHLTGDETPSGDFNHFVFSSLDLAFIPGGIESAPGSVYDNEIDTGTLKIVSKTPGGGDIPQDAGGLGGSGEFIKIPAVSPDGSHILMSTLAPGGKVHLYMRVNDAVSYEVSGSEGAELIGMSTDGSTVAFTSDSALVPEDTDLSRDLYLWHESNDEVTLVSQGNGHGNSDSCNANWTEACNVVPITPERPDIDDLMAADGDVYFYSPEQLDAANPGVINQRNLYHLRNGQVQYVTSFDPGTQADRMQISADGQHAAFLTKAELTGYDANYFASYGVAKVAREMYAFDAASGELQCASCNPTGAPPSVLRPDPPGNEAGTTGADVAASLSGRFMSDDGRVAFSTAEGLAPRDSNERIDVYEFVGGGARLISAGTGDRDQLPKLAVLFPGQNTGFEAISRDGVDLYFSTFDTLAAQDENGAFIKFYDARTTGGFPVLGQLLPCEAADECHGDTSAPVANPQIGTGTPYSVQGNVTRTHAKKKRRKRGNGHKSKKQRQGQAQSQKRAEGRNG